MLTTDWHRKVYKKKKKKIMDEDNWKKLRDACFKRDHYACYRCEKINKSGKGMSAHHLIPRSEDGADELTNLITLCHECHDVAEVENLRTLVDIVSSYTGGEVKIIKLEDKKHGEESFVRPSWHGFVYGGQHHRQGAKNDDVEKVTTDYKRTS